MNVSLSACFIQENDVLPYELTRAMPCHVPSPLHLHNRGITCVEHIAGRGAFTPKRKHRVMLKEQQSVRAHACEACVNTLLLQG